jgi:Pyruvate/2-oxoacid:ferredoxin oxidoreductase delta subunit
MNEINTRYKILIVYYFSGSGNSRNVAGWLCDVGKERGMECRSVNIADIDRRAVDPPPSDALIAFVSPVHGFNYPPIMMHFIMHFPKGKNNVLLLNTRAGMLIGKFITPGLTGIAFYFASFFLLLKGYSLKAMYPVNLPSNWISIHPGLNERTVRYLHEKCREKVKRFAANVFAGGSNFKGMLEIIQDTVAAPISLGYYFVGRFLFAKSLYASRECDNCGVCIKGCPVHAIVEVDHRPFWTFDCESCMKCIGTCPRHAIETAHGFIIVFWILFSSVILVLFYEYATHFIGPVQNGILRFVLETVLMLLLLGVAHRLMHYLLKCGIVERLMAYTSLTTYGFWGRKYRAPKE